MSTKTLTEPGKFNAVIQPGTSFNSAIERFRIDPTAEIGEPPVYCKIGHSPVMTGGNLSLITGKAKGGKTFLTGAVVAACLSGVEMLGCIRGSLPEGKGNTLYIDTEQSPYHALRSIKRICKQSKDDKGQNLHAYALRPLTPAERLETIEELIRSTPELGIVVIDGIRDLLTYGINDEEEATSLLSRFLKWTADYNMHLIVLLHQNKNDLNARGHVGTETLNKSETTISVAEKGGIFTVSCDYSRDMAFDDFHFMIDENGLPVAVDAPEPAEVKKGNSPLDVPAMEHIEKLNKIYSTEERLNGVDLQKQIAYRFEIGQNKARDSFLTHYMVTGWIEKKREGKHTYYVYNKPDYDSPLDR